MSSGARTKVQNPLHDHPKWDVDGCESYDLRSVVQKIMHAQNWILDRLVPEQTLFIVIGELHVNQMDIFLQHAVLKAHARQRENDKDRRFSVGCEMPHNFLARRNGYDREDEHGVHAMNSYIERPEGSWSVEAQRALLRYCATEKISVNFNDAAYLAQTLDANDLYTSALMDRYPHLVDGKAKDSIKVSDPDGIALRNMAMVERSIAHARQTSAKIYILLCGNLHVVGCDKFGCRHSDSVSAQFLKHGHAVLPVLNRYEHFGYDIGKEGRALMDATGVKIKYLEHIFEGTDEALGLMPYEQARATVNKYSDYDL